MLIDSGVAVLLSIIATRAVLDPPGPAFTGPVWLAWVAGAAVALPLAVRRRWPLPIFGFLVAATAVATFLGAVGIGALWVTYAATALALYTVAAEGRRVVVTGLALVGGLAVPARTIPWIYHRFQVTPVTAPTSELPLWWPIELGMVGAELIIAWAVGRLVRWRRTLLAEFARRLARDAVAEERLRIARELHDIVGHSMGLIAVKATVANHIAEERPTETRAALRTIEHTSRSALAEIRRLLGVLRADDDPLGDLAPAPGTSDLPSLATRLRSAGLAVNLTLGEVDALPEALDLTVYRIVQESVTNVLKHANAERCWVSVQTADELVRVTIADNGRGRRISDPAAGGHGIIGMRERVTMYGGTFRAGPRPEGGFQVIADLPYVPQEDGMRR
ncbi:Signal transduction histidine kinase [Microlunatus soli]|uniref:histidine kinase n=1 Tax=Microlunatus soli TaxID=630515 RepID=A0A1H1NUY1_9ACTN|nr:Signal transduction histidine kinase [Microlunatus soli]